MVVRLKRNKAWVGNFKVCVHESRCAYYNNCLQLKMHTHEKKKHNTQTHTHTHTHIHTCTYYYSCCYSYFSYSFYYSYYNCFFYCVKCNMLFGLSLLCLTAFDIFTKYQQLGINAFTFYLK